MPPPPRPENFDVSSEPSCRSSSTRFLPSDFSLPSLSQSTSATVKSNREVCLGGKVIIEGRGLDLWEGEKRTRCELVQRRAERQASSGSLSPDVASTMDHTNHDNPHNSRPTSGTSRPMSASRPGWHNDDATMSPIGPNDAADAPYESVPMQDSQKRPKTKKRGPTLRQVGCRASCLFARGFSRMGWRQ